MQFVPRLKLQAYSLSFLSGLSRSITRFLFLRNLVSELVYKLDKNTVFLQKTWSQRVLTTLSLLSQNAKRPHMQVNVWVFSPQHSYYIQLARQSIKSGSSSPFLEQSGKLKSHLTTVL